MVQSRYEWLPVIPTPVIQDSKDSAPDTCYYSTLCMILTADLCVAKNTICTIMVQGLMCYECTRSLVSNHQRWNLACASLLWSRHALGLIGAQNRLTASGDSLILLKGKVCSNMLATQKMTSEAMWRHFPQKTPWDGCLVSNWLGCCVRVVAVAGCFRCWHAWLQQSKFWEYFRFLSGSQAGTQNKTSVICKSLNLLLLVLIEVAFVVIERIKFGCGWFRSWNQEGC